MARIEIVDADTTPWQRVRDAVAPEVAAKMSPAESEANVRILHPGKNQRPQLFEASIAPNETVALHAHAADEIIYVLAGELKLGRQRLGPGASVFIAAQTLYGFSAGADGVRFLNFRADANTSFITEAEFRAAAAQTKAR